MRLVLGELLRQPLLELCRTLQVVLALLLLRQPLRMLLVDFVD